MRRTLVVVASLVFLASASAVEMDAKPVLLKPDRVFDGVALKPHEGWVVLVRGTAHHIDTEAQRASIGNIGLESWVEGEPEHFIRVDPVSIAGQRLRSA